MSQLLVKNKAGLENLCLSADSLEKGRSVWQFMVVKYDKSSDKPEIKGSQFL